MLLHVRVGGQSGGAEVLLENERVSRVAEPRKPLAQVIEIRAEREGLRDIAVTPEIAAEVREPRLAQPLLLGELEAVREVLRC